MNKKEDLKVLHVSTPMSWRGGEQQVFYLMTELQKMGIHQTLFCPRGSELAHRSLVEGFILEPFTKRGGFDLLAARKLSSFVKSKSFNIIHAHDAQAHTLCILAATFFRLRSDSYRIPILLSRRVDFPIKKRWLTQFKYNHPQIKRIICVSDAISEVVRSGIQEPKKAVTIHSGIELSKFTHSKKGKLKALLNFPPETVLVGNVAALADHKDYPTFLRTAKILLQTNPDIKFPIIGDGPLKSQMEQLTIELGISESVIFTGFRNDIPELLPDLDVFLFTSKTEGLGTSILDAFAAGVPVVATNAGGIPELVIHEKTGLLADIGDSKNLAVFVNRILENQLLCETLKQNALEHLKQFTVEHTADRTHDLYQKVLSENR